MDYTIKPSAERDNGPITEASKAAALEAFLDTFSGYTLYDLGPKLTCTEAEVLAELFVEHGRHGQADQIRIGHIEDDDAGDTNHNTHDGFKYGDPELVEDGDPELVTEDEALIGQYVEDVLWGQAATA